MAGQDDWDLYQEALYSLVTDCHGLFTENTCIDYDVEQFHERLEIAVESLNMLIENCPVQHSDTIEKLARLSYFFSILKEQCASLSVATLPNITVTHRVSPGGPGRPRIEIQPTQVRDITCCVVKHLYGNFVILFSLFGNLWYCN